MAKKKQPKQTGIIYGGSPVDIVLGKKNIGL